MKKLLLTFAAAALVAGTAGAQSPICSRHAGNKMNVPSAVCGPGTKTFAAAKKAGIKATASDAGMPKRDSKTIVILKE